MNRRNYNRLYRICHLTKPTAKLFQFYNAYWHYFKKYGWLNTYETKESIDVNGKPIPWLTYSAIDFIKTRIKFNINVFEYGSGNSTLYFADKVKNVVSVEHDELWYSKMKMKCSSNKNISLHLRELKDDSYSKSIYEFDQKFDLIIIDGRLRVKCAKNATNAISENGIIIFDNTERDYYSDGINHIKENGFKCIDFFGFIPIYSTPSQTSIFYRKNNIFDI